MGNMGYTTERLDHLGIVAGVCREIGLAAYLDEQAVGSQQQVSIGTATTAMVLNGLGFSNRQLYLVPQFFANKPVERLLGPGVTAEQLNDDCLGRTLDWLAAHDLTAAVCRVGLPGPAGVWHRPAVGACGHHLLLGQWGLRAGGGRRRSPSPTATRGTIGPT